MSIELVSAFARGRGLSGADAARLRQHRADRGRSFFSDLLYTMTHHYFAPETAEGLWGEILSHGESMTVRLGRDVGIVVAALDYLSNATSEMSNLTLISEQHISKITTLAMHDGMTGLFNHSACHELLDLELRNRRRYGFGISVLLLDVDDFKSINDVSGHQRGDRVLAELGKALVAAARDSDICCRLGGDEFVVILRLLNDPREAYALAERIRARVTSMAFDGHRIGVSIGVALCKDANATSHGLLESADRALYRAKASGKNRVILSDDGPSERRGAGSEASLPPELADPYRDEDPPAAEPATTQHALSGWEDDGGNLGADTRGSRRQRPQDAARPHR